MIERKRLSRVFWDGSLGKVTRFFIGITSCKTARNSVSITLAQFASAPAAGDLFPDQLVRAAIERTTHAIDYDGSYTSIGYPGDDVAANKGVCTDVIIRSYRKLGIDLQRVVHEDMRQNFDA